MTFTIIPDNLRTCESLTLLKKKKKNNRVKEHTAGTEDFAFVAEMTNSNR